MTTDPSTMIENLTKPATVLIERISDAVGGLFKPWQIVRVAQAEAEADQVRAQSGIKISDLQRRAMRRFLEEEGRKQSNIEEITRKALPLLNSDSSPDKMTNGWISNFFDKSRVVSDPEMQQLWAAVLAGEANLSGSFSRKTVNMLPDLESGDAELFTALLGFAWVVRGLTPLVYDVTETLYVEHGINFQTLSHLDSLGLIRFQNASIVEARLPQKVTVTYYGRPVHITFLQKEHDLSCGAVNLARAGVELARVCKPKPIDGFFDYVYERWFRRMRNLRVNRKAGAPGL